MIKKILLISLVLALALCVSGCLVNYRSYTDQHRLKWAAKHFGGEITIEYGFGWESVHVYGMTPEESDSHKITFSVYSLLLSFASLYVVCMLVCFVIAMLLKMKKH